MPLLILFWIYSYTAFSDDVLTLTAPEFQRILDGEGEEPTQPEMYEPPFEYNLNLEKVVPKDEDLEASQALPLEAF